MYYITDTDRLEDPELQIYTKLSETQLYHCREPHKGLFIAESPKVIERALNAGYKPVSMLMDRQQMKGEGAEILERIGALEGDPLPVYMAEETVLRNLTGFPLTRGCLCAMERKELPSVEGAWYGCGASDPWMRGSFIQKSSEGEHGNGFSDSLDFSRRPQSSRLAASGYREAPQYWIQDRGNGTEDGFSVHLRSRASGRAQTGSYSGNGRGRPHGGDDRRV